MYMSVETSKMFSSCTQLPLHPHIHTHKVIFDKMMAQFHWNSQQTWFENVIYLIHKFKETWNKLVRKLTAPLTWTKIRNVVCVAKGTTVAKTHYMRPAYAAEVSYFVTKIALWNGSRGRARIIASFVKLHTCFSRNMPRTCRKFYRRIKSLRVFLAYLWPNLSWSCFERCLLWWRGSLLCLASRRPYTVH